MQVGTCSKEQELLPELIDIPKEDASLNRLAPCDFYTRTYRDSDEAAICSWVTSRKALERISGDQGDRLTKTILTEWIMRSEETIVIAPDPFSTPIGFCTMSQLETSHLPASHIEICHLIVAPTFRHLLIGSHICTIAKSIAFAKGYRFVCGRVLTDNKYTLILARLHHFDEVTTPELWATPGFRWFSFDLTKSHLFHRKVNAFIHEGSDYEFEQERISNY